MKASHIFLSILALTIVLSCSDNNEQGQQTLEEVTKQELVTALAERDELLSLVKEVSNGLEQIKQLENIMTLSATNTKESAGKKTQILSDISILKEKIQQRKEQLQKLESKLQRSTINNKELQETVDALRIQMDSQIEGIESLKQQLTAANEQIGILNNAVDSLSTTISTVSVERDAAQEASVKLENELNACFFIVATKSELKEHNIIESGFLRKTKLMKGDFDKGSFIISDKRILDTLLLMTKKAKILTNHPETSYEIIEENGQKIIRIIDPEQFWSLTNYLVIQKD